MESIVVRVAQAQDASSGDQTHTPLYTVPSYTIPSYTIPNYNLPSTFAIHPVSTPSSSAPSKPTTVFTMPPHENNKWNTMNPGLRSGVALVCFLGLLCIVLVSVWYCCGCCGLRWRLRERRRVRRETANPNPRHLEMGEAQAAQQRSDTTAVAGAAPDAPPPQYDEVVPPEHRTLGGGVPQMREEDEGVISDGKTPLSELTLEDVVLDHSPSEGSARTFQERHHQAGGDTTGHTNV